jgi:hypothetical protein
MTLCGVKKKRSRASRRSSGSSLSSSGRKFVTREKEVIVYHIRSAKEREAAAERNKLER